jgi:crotonobetainyl-CoA:carnitine CoA-transferase CaiB-like acyl-CoA transferase
MGPTAGLILADMGAEVIKIERTPKGDNTRYLEGSGSGFFDYLNRNKKSLCLDLKSTEGREIIYRLVPSMDVILENFGPGTVDKLGLGYQKLSEINPRLIYCSLKGFMPGPYEKRLALDEVVQMMGGLASMAGSKEAPSRAGASVVDIVGGSYGALGIVTALYDRERTGKGQYIIASLFESVVFLVGQHMAYTAVTGKPAPTMLEKLSTWAIYDLFESKEGKKVFIGVTSDQQWARFCQTFGFEDLAGDTRLSTNNHRIEQRTWLLPELKTRIENFPWATLTSLLEKADLPFAPVSRPEDLFDDVHLNESGGLVETKLTRGTVAKLPKIPLRIGSYDFGIRNHPPEIGEGSLQLLKGCGFSDEEIEGFKRKGVLVVR